MKLFLSEMGFKEKLKQSSSNKTIDDKQICLSLFISNSQLYISHMPTYHCSSRYCSRTKVNTVVEQR
jgi:hypothetical protein